MTTINESINRCFLFIIFSYIFYSCQFKEKQQALHPSQCQPFKQGVFYNEAQTYKVERIGNKQIEYDLTNNISYHFEVHWLYDCAYNLTFKHSNQQADTFALNPNDMMRIQLIAITDSSFTYEVDFKNERYENTLYLSF